MANERHLSILMNAIEKQDISIWNEWRTDNGVAFVYLSGADCEDANLEGANLEGANLKQANLKQANLEGANLPWANLEGANLVRTGLSGANLKQTNLRQANLTEANLTEANLSEANLEGANLEGANLFTTKLSGANLKQANLSGAFAGFTIFANVYLSTVEGLATVEHLAPSSIGIDTLYFSEGNIPTEFLEGCGVPESMITYAKSLVGKAIEYYSCFISYNSQNEEFAKRLAERMKSAGLRVWFAPDDIKGGRKIHEQIYEAIRYHDKLIIVLSEDSMNSNWVETEIRRARKRERDEKRRVLFPIRLVDYESLQDWQLFDADEGRDLAQEIREYFIPDFSNWKNHDSFTEAFDRLVADLRKGE